MDRWEALAYVMIAAFAVIAIAVLYDSSTLNYEGEITVSISRGTHYKVSICADSMILMWKQGELTAMGNDTTVTFTIRSHYPEGKYWIRIEWFNEIGNGVFLPLGTDEFTVIFRGEPIV